jgi:drug/metabolite transporter (DMT)-like permease
LPDKVVGNVRCAKAYRWVEVSVLVYLLAIIAALVVAVGEVIQQRSAAQAPPEHNLSIRLLLWLVRQPRWLAGLAASIVGNMVFATAVGRGNVVLVEAVFVVRLLFAVIIAALWGRRRVPSRDVLGSLAIAAGLVGFLLAGHPSKGSSTEVHDLKWLIGGGSVVVVALGLTASARRMAPVPKAAVLGTGGGLLFGLQASLTQNAIGMLSHNGVVALLATWTGYAVAAVAVLGMLLVQSAFEAAPLTASYPAVVTAELISGVLIGIVVLGGSLRLAPTNLAIVVIGLLMMIAGIYLLTTSSLVTGQLDELARRQDIGAALRIEQRLTRELHRADRAVARAHRQSAHRHRWGARRLDRELARINAGVDRLCRLQNDIRQHRQAERDRLHQLPQDQQRQMVESHRTLIEQEQTIEEQARRIQQQVATLVEQASHPPDTRTAHSQGTQ